MKVFTLPVGASPREQGRAHGEAFRPMIRDLAALRLGLTVEIGGFASTAQVLGIAEKHLPILEAFDRDLYAEFMGIAEGSGLDPARLVVLNHYTDLRDIDPAVAATPAEDDCSVVYTATAGGALLGQTWDMHGSAYPYVMMLEVPARGDEPAASLFSLVGCLGMTGMNSRGLGITINNLKSLDAKVGVLWPALVRRVLKEAEAEAGRDVILDSPLGSGHHYLVATDRSAYGIETSGQKEKVVFSGEAAFFVHTNHCVDDEMAAVNAVSSESTTHLRYETLCESLGTSAVADRADLWRRLGSHDGYPRSVCTHAASPEAPHKMRTCGGLIMDLRAKNLWATAGCMNEARPEVFSFD